MKLKGFNWKIWTPVILVAAYLLTRFINLTIIPIFVDEAIYTRWTQIIAADPGNNFFIPLSDGKQPLFMWIAALFIKFFSDPLVVTRSVSVFAGLIGVWGSYLLAKEFFGKRVGILTAVLFILCPFLLLYNRLAVVDGMLTTLFIFTIYFAYRLIKNPNFKNSIFLGIILGLGVLTKSTAAIGILFIPVSLVFLGTKKSNQQPEQRISNWIPAFAGMTRGAGMAWVDELLRLIGFWILSLLIAFAMYRILKLSPLYYLINQRTPDFIYTPSEVLSHLFNPFIPRIGDVAGWLSGYLTLPVFAAAILGIVWLLKDNWRKGVFLGIYFLGPLAIEMEIAKGFTPRYFIYIAPVALLLAAYFLDFFASATAELFKGEMKRWAGIVLIAVILLPAALFEILLLTNPERAPIPEKEKTGYLEEWSAGYGITEIADYIKIQETRSKAPITVGTEGVQGYGTLPDGLEIYLRGVENVTVVGEGQSGQSDLAAVPPGLISDAKTHPAYLVVNDDRMLDKSNKVLELIAKYPKADGGDPLLFYQIKAD